MGIESIEAVVSEKGLFDHFISSELNRRIESNTSNKKCGKENDVKSYYIHSSDGTIVDLGTVNINFGFI